MTAWISFVGASAFELTFCSDAKVATRVILEADVFHARRKRIVGRIQRWHGANQKVSFEAAARKETRHSRSSFPDRFTVNAVGTRRSKGNIVRIHKSSRWLAKQPHDVTVLEVRIMT